MIITKNDLVFSQNAAYMDLMNESNKKNAAYMELVNKCNEKDVEIHMLICIYTFLSHIIFTHT